LKKDKWTALLLRISKKERQGHERRPISGRSRCQTARSLLTESQACSRAHALFARARQRSGRRARAWRMRAPGIPYRAWTWSGSDRCAGHRPLLPVRRRVGPAAGYSGLANPSSGEHDFWKIANTHTNPHSRSLARLLGRAAAVGAIAICVRIERMVSSKVRGGISRNVLRINSRTHESF
jgi:hypothetical protein